MCYKYLLCFLFYGVFCIRFLTYKFLACILGLKIKLKKLFPLFLAFIVALRKYAFMLKFDPLGIICSGQLFSAFARCLGLILLLLSRLELVFLNLKIYIFHWF